MWFFCDFVIFVCDFLWLQERCTKKNQWFAPRIAIPITVLSRAVGRCCDGGNCSHGGPTGMCHFSEHHFRLFPWNGVSKERNFSGAGWIMWLTAVNDNRQQIPLLRITRYDGGPARRRRRRAASLVRFLYVGFYCIWSTKQFEQGYLVTLIDCYGTFKKLVRPGGHSADTHTGGSVQEIFRQPKNIISASLQPKNITSFYT